MMDNSRLSLILQFM